ncbi:MAG: ferrous iron transport protein B [Dysgonamonadaceae bacterium]|jgi:ferrous iron transport protein B|nr:ferrous iron transport protein B [Dysgonamonadaceae bacterium]
MRKQQETIRYLSGLAIGESAIITKIKGYGAFRKRITEMGFVYGTRVKAIKKAPFPFQDPTEYELMGYRVSLRTSEAHMIEIVGEDEIAEKQSYEGTLPADEIDPIVRKKGKTIQVALVGNPNSGKTTLFNYATKSRERVGNYGGVTVDIKTAHLSRNGYRINLADLPGTYSVSEYSPEELYVRKHLTETMPDVVVNVVDSSNLERNLFLTTQLIDMNIKVVIALNMYDELEAKGDRFDYGYLGKMIGIPFVPTIASKGKGIEELMDTVIHTYEEQEPVYRHIHINYGDDINHSIDRIKTEVKKNHLLTDRFHAQYVALKLLENDRSFREQITLFPNTDALIRVVETEIAGLEGKYNTRIETVIADAKYAFIRGALKETYQPAVRKENAKGYRLDHILTNKWLGIPLFIAFMWGMFQATFSLGNYPMEWIKSLVALLNDWIRDTMPAGMLCDLLTDGVIGGVGGVIVFLPNILILFLCISLMEDTGYMARAAFIMDKLMHKIGLHGKSFIPMLTGFGCNVPAVMATRTLENRKDRLLTMLIIPFMSCSARLPVYVLFISVFFEKNQAVVMLSIYAIGVALAVLMAILFNKVLFQKRDIPFVMELPPYRWPTLRNIWKHTGNKSGQYLKKMGTIILVASVLVWALGYFPQTVDYSQDYEAQMESVQCDPSLPDDSKKAQLAQLSIDKEAERMENSYIGRFGHFIAPAIAPLGYDWKIGVSILTGMGAKEIVISSMGVLYQSEMSAGEDSVALRAKLKEQPTLTPLVAYSFMVFVLIYFPCIAVLVAIRKEAGLKWALFTALYTTALAWIVAFCIYQAGQLWM